MTLGIDPQDLGRVQVGRLVGWTCGLLILVAWGNFCQTEQQAEAAETQETQAKQDTEKNTKKNTKEAAPEQNGAPTDTEQADTEQADTEQVEAELEAAEQPLTYQEKTRLYGLPALPPAPLPGPARQAPAGPPQQGHPPQARAPQARAPQARAIQPPAANRPPARQPPAQRPLAAATHFRLQRMQQQQIPLSPAMRWYAQQRDPVAVAQAPLGAAPSIAPAKFYPGISRAQPPKPFTDAQREPSGLERYWPLLLEGRQDPNTGWILWRLP